MDIKQTGDLDSAFDSDAAKVEELTDEKLPQVVNEYGYGFWMRFLTTYPKRLVSGKNAPWYFVARLTRNVELDDLQFGDRLLAIFQGVNFYHFTTCNNPD